ncbi:MAG: TIGR00159 family protein [Deltaproteobacteria bacterium]|nr:TIGR00159 family protein [Deltaproteobacteria bacterium]
MIDFLREFELQMSWRDAVDILLVAFVYYRIILMVKGTRAVSVIIGLLLILIVYYMAGEFGFYTLHWLLTNFLGSIFLVVIILFRRDIRKALSEMGAGRFWRSPKLEEQVLNELVLALVQMARERIGALVVLEKRVPLGDVTERGVELQAKLSKDLLLTIFHPDTPLHDGAVIVQRGLVKAAGCILPLAVGVRHKSTLGTRHRAAMGITEETDAVAVVVSEERGTISVAIGGKLTSSLDENRLQKVLTAALER